MAVFSKRRVIREETGDIARELNPPEGPSRGGGGSVIAGLASAIALIFSGISLYHSVLKQPELRVYLASTLQYTRDPATNGEVFVVPLTVANHGARDGTVLRFKLLAEPSDGSGPSKAFEATYVVGEDYFVKAAGLNANGRGFERVDRPRQPFAPLSVAGRSNFTGTLLFTRAGTNAFPRVLNEKTSLRITLQMTTTLDQSLGPIDTLLTRPIEDVVVAAVSTRRADDSRLKRGSFLPLKLTP